MAIHYFLYCNKSVTAASVITAKLTSGTQQKTRSHLHPSLPPTGDSCEGKTQFLVSQQLFLRSSTTDYPSFSNGNSWRHFPLVSLDILLSTISTSSVFPSRTPTFCLPLTNSGISSAEPLTQKVPVLLATI